MVKLLLEFGADVGAQDREGRIPFPYVVGSEGSTATVKLLLELGADADARDDDNRPPLSYAAALERGKRGTDVIELLVGSGKGVDCD